MPFSSTKTSELNWTTIGLSCNLDGNCSSSRNEQNSTDLQNKYIMSLSSADQLVGISLLYLLVKNYTELSKYPFMCHYDIASFNTAKLVSLSNMMTIAIDRYIYIVHPFFHMRHVTARRVNAVIAVQWCLAFLLCYIPVYLITDIPLACNPFYPMSGRLDAIAVAHIANFFVASSAIGTMYGLIARVAKDRMDRKQKKIRDNATVFTNLSTTQTNLGKGDQRTFNKSGTDYCESMKDSLPALNIEKCIREVEHIESSSIPGVCQRIPNQNTTHLNIGVADIVHLNQCGLTLIDVAIGDECLANNPGVSHSLTTKPETHSEVSAREHLSTDAFSPESMKNVNDDARFPGGSFLNCECIDPPTVMLVESHVDKHSISLVEDGTDKTSATSIKETTQDIGKDGQMARIDAGNGQSNSQRKSRELSHPETKTAEASEEAAVYQLKHIEGAESKDNNSPECTDRPKMQMDHENKQLKPEHENQWNISSLRWIRQMVIVFGVFVVCWTPSMVCNLLSFTYQLDYRSVYLLSMLGTSNSAANFFVYSLCNKQFSAAIKKLLSTCCKRRM